MGYRSVKVDGVSISLGNTKLHAVPSVACSPCKGCRKDVPCLKECYYAAKAYKQYPQTRNAADNNLDIQRKDPERFFGAIGKFCADMPGSYFRLYVAGDFSGGKGDLHARANMARFAKMAGQLAGKKRFLVFTKEKLPECGFFPQNCSVVASQWPGWENTPPDGYPCAWMRDPKNPDPRIPENVLECPGVCETCGMCWQLPRLGLDVVFDKH